MTPRPDDTSGDSIAQENVARLLAEAYRPVEPSALFVRRLRNELLEAQARAIRSRRAYRSIAAAALLAVAVLAGFIVRTDSTTSSDASQGVAHVEGHHLYQRALTRSETRLETRSETEPGWFAVDDGAVELSPGDHLAVGAGGSARTEIDRTTIELEPESIIQFGGAEPTRFERGRTHVTPLAALDPDQDATVRELTAAFLSLRHRGARFTVNIQQAPPAIPVDKEFRMNRNIAVGASAAVIVVVTIAVWYQQNDQSVEVDTPDGGTVVLAPGDTGAFSSDGSVRVVKDGTADDEKIATEDVDPASAEPRVIVEDQPKEKVVGQVVNAQGEGLPAAILRFERPDETGGTSVLGRATADEEGNFELNVPIATEGNIVVEVERYETGSYAWPPKGETTDDPESADSTATADASPSETRDADTPIEREPIVITLTTETAIAGRFFDEQTGSALPSALIGIQRYVDQYQRDQPLVKFFESEDGTFYWGGITPGKYRVWSYKKDYARSAEANIEVLPGQLYGGVELAMTPGTRLIGSVYSERTGRPVSGAIVYPHLEHLMGTVNFMDRAEVDDRVRNATRTNERGEFVLDDLPPGPVLIRVLHSEYMPRDVTVEVAESGDSEVEISIKQGTGFLGKAVDANGEPVPEMRILAVTMSMNPELSQLTWSPVDEDGNYHIPNLNPGSYILIMINMETGATPKIEMDVLGATEDKIHNFVDLPTLATLRGRVVDEDGEPVGRVGVSLMSETDPSDPESGGKFSFETGSTDLEGYYEITNIEPGRYSIGVSLNSSGAFTMIDRIECTEATDYEKDLVFVNLSVNGFVADPEGAAVSNSEVIVMRKKDGKFQDFAGRALTDHEGAYHVPGLREGEYRIIARAEGYALAAAAETVKLDPEKKREATVDVTVVPGGVIVVTVVDQHGNRLPDVLVHVINGEGGTVNGSLEMVTDEFGKYTFSSLAPGVHQVRVFHAGKLEGEKSFETTTDKPVQMSFELEVTK